MKSAVMNSRIPGAPQITPHDPEHSGSPRDPEERRVDPHGNDRERSYDKTLADSFPTSDPPSSIPDPSDRPPTPSPGISHEDLLAGLKEGTWAALSIENSRLVGTGATQDEAAASAQQRGHGQIQLIRVPAV
jgi:hypothetical protein